MIADGFSEVKICKRKLLKAVLTISPFGRLRMFQGSINLCYNRIKS